jgi:hypothetical protein
MFLETSSCVGGTSSSSGSSSSSSSAGEGASADSSSDNGSDSGSESMVGCGAKLSGVHLVSSHALLTAGGLYVTSPEAAELIPHPKTEARCVAQCVDTASCSSLNATSRPASGSCPALFAANNVSAEGGVADTQSRVASMAVVRVPDSVLSAELFDVSVQLYDQYGQQVIYSDAAVAVMLSSTDPQLAVTPVAAVARRGWANLTDVSIKGSQGSYTLSLEATMQGQVVAAQALPLTLRGCAPGDVTQVGGCKPCANKAFNITYSFYYLNETCDMCPEGAECSGVVVAPQQGFWHSSLHSNQLHE